jgi:hypothetical protein
MEYSGARGTLIYEKNMMSKIKLPLTKCHYSFAGYFLFTAEVVGATEKGEVNIYAPDQVSYFNCISNQRERRQKKGLEYWF